jgi:hypothetical protein
MFIDQKRTNHTAPFKERRISLVVSVNFEFRALNGAEH